jgi:hypothetical protein
MVERLSVSIADAEEKIMRALLCTACYWMLAIGCSAPPDEKAEAIASKADKQILADWWYGDGSQCSSIDPDANLYFDGQTDYVEKGLESGTDYGHPGCEKAYIIDHWIPDPHRSNYWAWTHIATRPSANSSVADANSDQWTCENSWTNLRVFWWILTNQNTWQDNGLVLQSSRQGTWTGSGCNLNFPDNLNMWSPAGTPTNFAVQSVYRTVSQRGLWIVPGLNHYTYMVTNPG